MTSNLERQVRDGFRISARTVLELGSELISSDIIAFYELVKNAFDAGSRTGVEIRFIVPLRRNAYLRLRARISDQAVAPELLLAEVRGALDSAADPDRLRAFRDALGEPATHAELLRALDEAYRALNTIEISDTGSGMSLQDLRDNYLVIGTPNRKRAVEAAVQTASQSPYLGEKGIGRLSAMRLGERLRVQTALAEDPQMNLLEIDWRRFEDLDALVEDIKIAPSVGAAKPSPSWSGTTLVIGDLSEDWTERRVSEMAEYDFARLVNPFIDAKKRPRIALFWNGSRIAVPWMDTALLDHAHAKFSGSYGLIDGEPILRCRLEAMDLGFPHPREVDVVTLSRPELEGAIIGASESLPSEALGSLGPFDFEAYWYNRRRLERKPSCLNRFGIPFRELF